MCAEQPHSVASLADASFEFKLKVLNRPYRAFSFDRKMANDGEWTLAVASSLVVAPSEDRCSLYSYGNTALPFMAKLWEWDGWVAYESNGVITPWHGSFRSSYHQLFVDMHFDYEGRQERCEPKHVRLTNVGRYVYEGYDYRRRWIIMKKLAEWSKPRGSPESEWRLEHEVDTNGNLRLPCSATMCLPAWCT